MIELQTGLTRLCANVIETFLSLRILCNWGTTGLVLFTAADLGFKALTQPLTTS
jgi:hypothetical protein